MSQLLKESNVVKALALKQITLDEAKGILAESNDGYKFSGGETIYVRHGIHAGSQGKFIKEANGGYAEVDLGAAGKSKIVPLIFLSKRLNK